MVNYSDWKHRERAQRIAQLPPIYHQALTASDITILSTPISELVQKIQSSTWDPVEVLRSYGKKTLKAQEATNCLTEVMISDAEKWAKVANKAGPLAGVPVSLKDLLAVEGYDTCYGYSSLVGKPATKESAFVKLLRDAGAVPFVKTAVPITMLSLESQSSIFGTARNPHVRTHTPGGSTGGEGALLAFGGSRIGIGTDVGGSVRVPAHFCGIYTIKAAAGRCPKSGGGSSVPGQEGIPPVYSPMARTLEDLEYFWKAIVSMKPWEYDPSCHPIPWRDVNLQGKKLTWGVMFDDGIVPPSPACERALRTVIEVLRKNGHHVVEFNPPSPYEAFQIATQLLMSDGGEIVKRPFLFLEPNDPGVDQIITLLRLPGILRTLVAWYYRYIRRDPLGAGIISGLYKKTTPQYYGLIVQRDIYRAKFFAAWQEAKIDFLLTVPNVTPALPLGGNKYSYIGYTVLFNLLDYTAGVLPVTKVSSAVDDLSSEFKSKLPKLNRFARDAYRNYDAKAMDGLPVGVQIVGQRLEEEKVMEGMKVVQSLLRESGHEYKPMNL